MASSKEVDLRQQSGTFLGFRRYTGSNEQAGSSVSVLELNRNVWRVQPARRMSVFPDVASCYAAMRSSMKKAQHAITIVGWDIDSRCRLVGPSGEPDDDLPGELAPFLKALCERTPNLHVNLLLWDFSSLYAMEREAFPRVKLAWDRADLRMDDVLPVGSSQHQKIVLIDDSVAFNGGLDLTIRRWDTTAHRIRDPHRVDPSGTPYDPFHDVQAVVDGETAHALAELVRNRWWVATGERLPKHQDRDCWPDDLHPDFEDVEVGVSRTVPSVGGAPEVREAEHLFLDMIEAAETSLYIENQYLTSGLIAETVARQVIRKPRLSVLIVAPRSHDPWLEAMTMRHGRIRFRKIIDEAGAENRVRFVYPRVGGTLRRKPVFVHSKVMIVDDKLLRIGSANLNNRSMGADSECDLVVEAASGAERMAISDLRNRLIGMHTGVSSGEVEAVLKTFSLVDASRRLGAKGRSFADVEDGEPDAAAYASYLERVADPERPIDQAEFLAMVGGDADPDTQFQTASWLALAALILMVISGAWGYGTGNVDQILGSAFADASSTKFAFVTVVGLFILGGLLLIPITLLIVATSAAFGVGWGIVYAAVGTLVSAALSYGIGAWLGHGPVRRVLGGKLIRIRAAIVRRGVIAIAAIRMVPIAPFTLVNVAAGAMGIGLVPYMAGTVLGMAPGFIVLSAVGHNLYRLISEPSLLSLSAAIGAVVLWVASTLIIQHWVKRYQAIT